MISLMKWVLWFYALISPFFLYQGRDYTILWIVGTVLLLFLILTKISHGLLVEEYSLKQFEKNWILDRKKEKGLKYRDGPGCYVLLLYRFKRILPFTFGYSEVYVGQSTKVYSRVHNHINRKGNGDVYADIRDGKDVVIDIYPCSPRKLNDLEKKLIRKYHAEKYYNRTSGGGKKRNLFGK